MAAASGSAIRTRRRSPGAKLQAELAFNDVLGAGSQVSAQYAFTHDNVRGDRHLVGARLRIPLGPAPAASAMPGQWLRMTDHIERDVDIVVAPSKEAVEDVLTEVDFDRVAYVDDGGSITTTSTNAGANTLILANGTVSGPQELQGNQTLQGGGSTIAVRGLASGAVADFTAPGATATLNNPGDAANLTLLGSNTHLAGLDIQGAEVGNNLNRGILGGSDKSNVVIEQTSISGTGSTGVFFDSANSDVAISGTTITDASSAGILLGSGNSNVTVSGTTITDAGSIGFLVRAGNSVALDNSTLAGTFRDFGIVISQANNTLSGIGNTAAGASFGDDLCEVNGAQTGSFAFDDDGTGNPATCP